jgi:hypothetical protein
MSPPSNTSGDSSSQEPVRPNTLAGNLVALAGVIVSIVYLSNLSMGVFPEIPDVIPLVGNLDEVFFTGVLITSLQKLGIHVLPQIKVQPRPLTDRMPH